MIKELWKDAKDDEAYAKSIAGGPDWAGTDDGEDWNGKLYEFRWTDRAPIVFVRSLKNVATCFVRGHKMAMEEGGDAESGPQFSWGCERCHRVGGWGSMYHHSGDDASKFRWQK